MDVYQLNNLSSLTDGSRSHSIRRAQPLNIHRGGGRSQVDQGNGLWIHHARVQSPSFAHPIGQFDPTALLGAEKTC